MKTKDYLITALAPCAVLLIPLAAKLFTEEMKWTLFDFVVMWFVLAGATFVYRLLATRAWSNFAYKAGAGLAVTAGFLVTWVNLAVQIIGDENPGNLLYFLALLGSLVGVGLSRFRPAGLAKVAFALAGILLLIPVVSVALWPDDFNPGYPKVQLLSSVFAVLFAASGLLFRHAADGTTGLTARTA